MLKPVSYKTDKHRADQKADDDFNITELLAKLNTYSDADFDSAWIQPQQQELETLAAILISQLTHSINRYLRKLIIRSLKSLVGANGRSPLRPELEMSNGKLIAWTSADIAWEEDLEPISEETNL